MTASKVQLVKNCPSQWFTFWQWCTSKK